MNLLVKSLLFTVIVPGTVAGWVPPILAAWNRDPVADWLRWVAFVCWGIGSAIYLWCLYDFAAHGRGTPAPIDAPKKLVVRGLYRVTRNPMYVGVLTAILGWAAFWGSGAIVAYAGCVLAAFHVFVVAYEEPTLERLFGDQYKAYKARVPRWVGIVKAPAESR